MQEVVCACELWISCSPIPRLLQRFDESRWQAQSGQDLSRSTRDLLKYLESWPICNPHRPIGCVAIVYADLVTALRLDSRKIYLWLLGWETKHGTPLTVDNSLSIAPLRLTADFVGDHTVLMRLEFYADLERVLFHNQGLYPDDVT